MPETAVQDVSRSYEIYITIAVTMSVLVLTTVLRVFGKLKYGLSLGWDDYLMVLGTSLNVIANAFDIEAARSGFGRHAHFLKYHQLVTAGKYAQMAVCVAAIAVWATKTSICFFLLGIIKRTHIVFFWCIWILMGFTTVTSFIGVLLWGLQAKPLPKLWDPTVPGTRDSPQGFLDVVYVHYGFGVCTDIVYALSPVYFLWNVRISSKQKLTILALTGSGILLTIVAALNIAFAREFLSTEDSTWALVKEFICDIIERNVCGFIANLPALWFLISRSRKHSASPHVNRHAGNYFESSTKGTQKLTSLPSAVIAKPQKLDPYDVEGDDCVPLRQRRSDHKGLGSNVSNQGSESGAEGGTEMGSTPGMACGWDDPTLETGYERTHSGKQNWERVRRPGP